MMSSVLKTYNLTKSYKNTNVVNKLNMSIEKGDIYGFIGKDGAGKTTTIKMITGLVKPTRGQINLLGDINRNKQVENFKRIGAIIEYPGSYGNLSAEENLKIHKKLMGIKDKSSIKETLKMVGLEDVGRKPVRKFSLGMKQRLGIARVLLHKPEFIILDEPTNGLDHVGIKEIREIILELNSKREITFLISSNSLSEVEEMVNKVGIMHKGNLLEEISYDEIQKKNLTGGKVSA